MKCAVERAKHKFFALPDPLSCFVMNEICLNQMYCHDLEVMRLNPGSIKLEVHSTSVLSCT